MGNAFLTLLSNMFADPNLTDMEACYKAFRQEIIQSIQIRENRLGFEPEVIAKVAKLNAASTRSASPITDAPTMKSRRSARKMAFEPFCAL